MQIGINILQIIANSVVLFLNKTENLSVRELLDIATVDPHSPTLERICPVEKRVLRLILLKARELFRNRSSNVRKVMLLVKSVNTVNLKLNSSMPLLEAMNKIHALVKQNSEMGTTSVTISDLLCSIFLAHLPEATMKDYLAQDDIDTQFFESNGRDADTKTQFFPDNVPGVESLNIGNSLHRLGIKAQNASQTRREFIFF